MLSSGSLLLVWFLSDHNISSGIVAAGRLSSSYILIHSNTVPISPRFECSAPLFFETNKQTEKTDLFIIHLPTAYSESRGEARFALGTPRRTPTTRLPRPACAGLAMTTETETPTLCGLASLRERTRRLTAYAFAVWRLDTRREIW